MDDAENLLIERHQTHKDHMLRDAMHMRRPEYVNLQGQWKALSHVWLFLKKKKNTLHFWKFFRQTTSIAFGKTQGATFCFCSNYIKPY